MGYVSSAGAYLRSLVFVLVLYNYAGFWASKTHPLLGKWLFLLPSAFAFAFVATWVLKLLTGSLYVVWFFPMWFVLGVYIFLSRSTVKHTQNSS